MSRRIPWLVALAALLALALAPAGMAASKKRTVKVARGATTLTLDSGAAAALQGVTITPLKPAKAKNGGIAFPVVAGIVRTDLSAGRVLHAGGLKLSKGTTILTIRRPTIVLGANARLTALVGGRRVTFARLDLTGVKASSKGRKATVTGVKLTLTKVAANALNARFGTSFSAGDALGTAQTSTRIVGKVHKIHWAPGTTYADPFA